MNPELGHALMAGYSTLVEAETGNGTEADDDQGQKWFKFDQQDQQGPDGQCKDPAKIDIDIGEGSPVDSSKVAMLAGSILSPRITDAIQKGQNPNWKDILGDAAELGITFIPGVGGIAKLGRLAKIIKASTVGLKVANVASKVAKSKAGIKAAKAVAAARKSLSPAQQKAAINYLNKIKNSAVKKVEKELRMNLASVGDRDNYKARLAAMLPKVKTAAQNYAKQMVNKVNSAAQTASAEPTEQAAAAMA
jgi:hypothetical protein